MLTCHVSHFIFAAPPHLYYYCCCWCSVLTSEITAVQYWNFKTDHLKCSCYQSKKQIHFYIFTMSKLWLKNLLSRVGTQDCMVQVLYTCTIWGHKDFAEMSWTLTWQYEHKCAWYSQLLPYMMADKSSRIIWFPSISVDIYSILYRLFPVLFVVLSIISTSTMFFFH